MEINLPNFSWIWSSWFVIVIVVVLLLLAVMFVPREKFVSKNRIDITKNNDTFLYEYMPGGGDTAIIIPHGVYTPESLATYLEYKLNQGKPGWSVEVDEGRDNKYKFKLSALFFYKRKVHPQSVYKVLGLSTFNNSWVSLENGKKM